MLVILYMKATRKRSGCSGRFGFPASFHCLWANLFCFMAILMSLFQIFSLSLFFPYSNYRKMEILNDSTKQCSNQRKYGKNKLKLNIWNNDIKIAIKQNKLAHFPFNVQISLSLIGWWWDTCVSSIFSVSTCAVVLYKK
jgi:hypothetical protein